MNKRSMNKPFSNEIPKTFRVAGMTHTVVFEKHKHGDSGFGEVTYPDNKIVLFAAMDGVPICRDQMIQTFWHEATHAILQAMGEGELNRNEKFVCCFSSLLNELMQSAETYLIGEEVEQ